ncbi:hypothetical protein CRG98_040545, partial [Punica granatum]
MVELKNHISSRIDQLAEIVSGLTLQQNQLMAHLQSEGRALQWHQPYVRSLGVEGKTVSWGEYVAGVVARFGDSGYEDPMVDLKNLRQVRSVQDYMTEFDALLNKVAIANGKELRCEKMCKKFQWRMQGREYEADMLLLSLESYDIVLGVQWLSTLGDILWNFKELHMKFMVEGKESVPQGTDSEELKTIKEEQMEKLLQRRDRLARVQLCTLEMACTSR